MNAAPAAPAAPPDPAEHVNVALWVAHRFARARNLDPGEVIGDAYLALAHACARYDPARGALAPYLFAKVRSGIIDRHRVRESRTRRINGVSVRVPREPATARADLRAAPGPGVGDGLERRDHAGHVLRLVRRRAVRHHSPAVAEMVGLLPRGLRQDVLARELGMSAAWVSLTIKSLRAAVAADATTSTSPTA